MAKVAINLATGAIQQEELIVGIDLGTTNSLVAYVHPDTRQPAAINDLRRGAGSGGASLAQRNSCRAFGRGCASHRPDPLNEPYRELAAGAAVELQTPPTGRQRVTLR